MYILRLQKPSAIKIQIFEVDPLAVIFPSSTFASDRLKIFSLKVGLFDLNNSMVYNFRVCNLQNTIINYNQQALLDHDNIKFNKTAGWLLKN